MCLIETAPLFGSVVLCPRVSSELSVVLARFGLMNQALCRGAFL